VGHVVKCRSAEYLSHNEVKYFRSVVTNAGSFAFLLFCFFCLFFFSCSFFYFFAFGILLLLSSLRSSLVLLIFCTCCLFFLFLPGSLALAVHSIPIPESSTSGKNTRSQQSPLNYLLVLFILYRAITVLFKGKQMNLNDQVPYYYYPIIITDDDSIILDEAVNPMHL